jgi:hypothetical protein
MVKSTVMVSGPKGVPDVWIGPSTNTGLQLQRLKKDNDKDMDIYEIEKRWIKATIKITPETDGRERDESWLIIFFASAKLLSTYGTFTRDQFDFFELVLSLSQRFGKALARRFGGSSATRIFADF